MLETFEEDYLYQKGVPFFILEKGDLFKFYGNPYYTNVKIDDYRCIILTPIVLPLKKWFFPFKLTTFVIPV